MAAWVSDDAKKEAQASKAQPERPMGGACEECSTMLQWIEIELVGEDGVGIPRAEYLVVTPDGREHTGVTGANGVARLENIRPGECKITFPKLDKDAWCAA